MAAAAIASPQPQLPNRITQPVDTSQVQPLPNHHPLWASAANDIGAVPADLPLNQFTLTLSRSPQQQQAFEQFLAGQQNPASPNFHHWLTPAEVGQRFGLSDQDIATITAWLQSQGLHVNWVAPSHIFIGFGGTAANIGQAFQTELHYYSVRGQQRLSVNADPMVPAAILPAIKAVRGLYTIDEQPNHQLSQVQSASPQLTISSTTHFMTPNDFDAIYDIRATVTGAGQTIGIVSWSRTNFADFDNFKSRTGATFADPTEVVPTAYGGIDPGPALTAPPTGNVSIGGQSEATLDVTRAGSVAPGAALLLVVSSPSGSNDGIGADAQYLVNTSPVPAQIMTISFGACESGAGSAGVAFWDQLFQSAAAEGISVFVSSGDSGASGCDTAFTAPPSLPQANSPNYICSSSYATCVGGTEFADAADPSLYWSSTNDSLYNSAFTYIPEGAWNESNASSVAATGGGVSTVISTPTWQTGTGVPSARTGRYTPDVSFSASAHDGYFACMAAADGSCVVTNGSFSFIAFSGTSAAAPGMAGIAALLDSQIGAPQGNINPQLYPLTSAAPSAFHDATPISSAVSTCDVNLPSMCNNSIPGASGTAVQAGFSLQAGYDEATGLGSLDVFEFINTFPAPIATPTVQLTLTPSTGLTSADLLQVGVTVTGVGTITPSGSVALSGAGYSSAPMSLTQGNAIFHIGAGVLPNGNDTLTATYTPDAQSSARYNGATASATFTVTKVGPIAPSVYVGPQTLSPTTAQPLTVVFDVGAGTYNPNPTGTFTLTSGSYTSGALNVNGGAGTITIPAQVLAVGVDTLTGVYTPDSASSAVYQSASGSATVTVSVAPKVAPSVGIMLTPSSINSAQALPATVNVSAGSANQIPTGSVTLTSGSYSSAPTQLSGGTANFNIPAGSLPIGTDTLVANYTPDSSSSAIYLAASGTNTIAVTLPPPPAFTIFGSSTSMPAGSIPSSTLPISVIPSNGFTGEVTLTVAIVSSPAGAQDLPTFSFGTTSPVTVTSAEFATAQLAIATTGSQTTSCVAANRTPRGIPWYAKGGAVMACLLLFGIAPRRRNWRAMLGAMFLLVALLGGVSACGGSKSCTPTTTSGTTTGTYTLTVTGTSGATTATSPPMMLYVE